MEARRIAARHGVPVTLVTGPSQRTALPSEGFEQIIVGGASEAVDDFIASRVGPGNTVVTDELFRDLKKHYSDAEIVELSSVIGLANYWNRFTTALRIDLSGTDDPYDPSGSPR